MQDPGTLAALEILVALLAVLAAVGIAARRAAVPYTLALVVFGLVVSVLAPPLPFRITPDLVLAVILPGLVFEAAFQLDARELRGTLGSVVVLAGPGVLLVAGLTALTLHLATGMALHLAFVVGAMVSATDPAAVIAVIRQIRAPRRLATLVEAESLFNDGTAIVLFGLALAAVATDVSAIDGFVRFVAIVAISVAIGSAAGIAASLVASLVDDHLVEQTITLVAAYGTFLLADRLHQSGIIATVVAGIVLGTLGRRSMTAESRREIDTIWAYIAFVLTALVFLLVGLATRPGQLLDAAVPIAWGIAAVLAGRAALVYGLLPVLSRTGGSRLLIPPLPRSWQHVVFWSGLRGGVAAALALSLPADIPDRSLLVGTTFGIVLFTLLVQGATAGLVVRSSRGQAAAEA